MQDALGDVILLQQGLQPHFTCTASHPRAAPPSRVRANSAASPDGQVYSALHSTHALRYTTGLKQYVVEFASTNSVLPYPPNFPFFEFCLLPQCRAQAPG
jgi:hypothetical protein